MPILEISVIPVGTQDPSFSSFISQACRIVEDEGLKYQITPTGTVVEGNLSLIMNVAQKMHQVPFSMGASRVISNITIDERHDKESDMERQVQAVKKNM